MAKVMPGLRQDGGYRFRQAFLLVAQHSQSRPSQFGQGFQESLEGGLAETAQPAATQGQAGQELTDEPSLGFAALGSQSVEADDQATVLSSGLGQVGPVLALVAGE
jgi:hypothetical protein